MVHLSRVLATSNLVTSSIHSAHFCNIMPTSLSTSARYQVSRCCRKWLKRFVIVDNCVSCQQSLLRRLLVTAILFVARGFRRSAFRPNALRPSERFARRQCQSQQDATFHTILMHLFPRNKEVGENLIAIRERYISAKLVFLSYSRWFATLYSSKV